MKNAIIRDDREIIYCDEKEYGFELDKKGYFLIKIDNNSIHCGYVKYNKKGDDELIVEMIGKKAENIIKEIAKRGLCSNDQHLAYIAYELGRAECALKHDDDFIQR